MIAGVQVKVCGLSTLAAAEWANQCGMDYLGFNFYPKSPRYISHAQFAEIAAHLPKRERVAVSVEPERDELKQFLDEGFDRVQIHFRADLPMERVAAWSDLLTADKLWLAPKIPPGTAFPAAALPLAGTFLLDTFQADKFGGTGKTGDWAHYRELRAAHSDKTWILSGGLNAENIGAALKATDARFVDVNSGIESAPGVKDLEKLKAFCAAVRLCDRTF